MTIPPWFITWLVIAWLPTPARAYGPGVHLRECDRFAALLADSERPLVAAADPSIRRTLHLGCVAPDLRQVLPSLQSLPTHRRSLGLRLVSNAQQTGTPPAFLSFALGHLHHHFSDASAEVLLIPHLTAQGFVGAIDLLDESVERPEGDKELYVEFVSLTLEPAAYVTSQTRVTVDIPLAPPTTHTLTRCKVSEADSVSQTPHKRQRLTWSFGSTRPLGVTPYLGFKPPSVPEAKTTPFSPTTAVGASLMTSHLASGRLASPSRKLTHGSGLARKGTPSPPARSSLSTPGSTSTSFAPSGPLLLKRGPWTPPKACFESTWPPRPSRRP